MGTRQSHLNKATSPYSSWGSSLDDLLCGTEKICGDQWTPLPSRSNSITSSRRHSGYRSKSAQSQRRHSYISTKHGHAEVYTIGQEDEKLHESERLYTHQPLPTDVVSTPLRDPSDYLGKRRQSYRPIDNISPTLPSQHSPNKFTYRSNALPTVLNATNSKYANKGMWDESANLLAHKKKKNSRKIGYDSNPAQLQPIQIFIDLNGTQQEIVLDKSNRGTIRVPHARKSLKRPSDHNKKFTCSLKSKSSKESAMMKQTLQPIHKVKSVPDIRKADKLRSINHTTTIKNDLKPITIEPSFHGSSISSAVLNRRVIPPRDKKHEKPPMPFRIRSVPDVPFTTIARIKN